jgi:hypothetical protein
VAKNDIGGMSTRVTCDTRDFVTGMANVQRRTEQTTAVLQKSRAAFSGLGSAMRLPGLGRSGALGGAASGIAGALGLGALGGGVVGLASTGAFMLVDGLIQRNERLKELAAERLETERKIHETLLEQMRATAQSVVDAQKVIDDALGRPAQQDSTERLNRISTLEAELARRLSTVRSGITEGRTWYQFESRRQQEFVQEARDALAAEIQRQRDAMVPPQANGLGGRLRGVGVEAFFPLFSSTPQDQLSKQSADGAAALAKELGDVLERAVDVWKRENQRTSDQQATVINRISSQITQLTFRRD